MNRKNDRGVFSGGGGLIRGGKFIEKKSENGMCTACHYSYGLYLKKISLKRL